MASGDKGISYNDVRYYNNLSSSECNDAVLDEHIKDAFYKVEKALRTKFSTAAITFTDIILDTRDLFQGRANTILYISDFYDYNNNFVLPLLTVTSLSYRSTDDDNWEEYDEGQDDEYILDLKTNAIKFNFRLNTFGNNNLKLSGTCGYNYGSNYANMPYEIKKWIALEAAISTVRYANSSRFNDIKTVSIGDSSSSEGTSLSSDYKETVEQLGAQLDDHLKANGLRKEKAKIVISKY